MKQLFKTKVTSVLTYIKSKVLSSVKVALNHPVRPHEEETPQHLTPQQTQPQFQKTNPEMWRQKAKEMGNPYLYKYGEFVKHMDSLL